MRWSLVRRLEALEARPVSGQVLGDVRHEWYISGIVPKAPPAAIKLTAMFAARIAELHAYVPSSPNLDDPQRRASLEHAAALHEIRKDPSAWMGCEFQLEER